MLAPLRCFCLLNPFHYAIDFFHALHICIFLWLSPSLKSFEVLNVDSVCLNIGLATVDIVCVICFLLLCYYLIPMIMQSIQHKKDNLILF